MLVQEWICVQVFAKRDLNYQMSEVMWYLCIVNFNIIMYHTILVCICTTQDTLMLDTNGVTIYGKSVLSESLDTHVRSYPKSASSAAMLSNMLLFLVCP